MFRLPATGRWLFQNDQRNSCRNNPTDSARKPRPSILSGVKPNAAIHCSEFPGPKPVALAAPAVQQPTKGVIDMGGERLRETKSPHCECRRPASFGIIAFEGRPASVLILRSQKR